MLILFLEARNIHTTERMLHMIKKGNPPSCSWLVVRKNQFGSKDFQIRFVDSRSQFAIKLIEEHFTRDEWNHFPFSSSDFTVLKVALITILKIALKPWPRDNKKVISMKESSPNRSQWEIWCAGPSTTPSSTVSSSLRNSDQKITKWGLKLERRHPVTIINQKTSVSEIEGVMRRPVRGPQRGRPWHRNRVKLRILQLVRVVLYFLL